VSGDALWRETIVVALLLVAAAVLWDRTRPGPVALSFGDEPARVPLVEIELDAAHLASLDAGVARGVQCRRPRGGEVPVRHVTVDGRELDGRFEVRYRGLCREHWSGRDKSLKLIGIDGARILGRAELNLNTIESDPELFDAWAGRVAHIIGAPATRTAFARVSINGGEPSLRVVVENLDRDLLDSHGLARGPIYREVYLATLGEAYSIDALSTVFRSTADRRAGFEPLLRLDRAIYDAARGVGDLDGVLDIDAYITYTALTILSGTGHVSDHNLPLYVPRRGARFVPIANDFSNDTLGEPARRFDALQSVWMSHNRLSQIAMSDPAIRGRVHRRVAEILDGHDLVDAYRTYVDAVARVIPELDDVDRAGIERRLTFLHREYLNPIARVSPTFRAGGRFQLAIEGAGAYRVRLNVDGDCAAGASPSFRVSVHAGEPQDAVDCVGGRWHARDLSVERMDIEPPSADERSHPWRNSAGVVLASFEATGGFGIESIEVVSLATGQAVAVRADWPFFIERAGEDRVSIGATDGWELVHARDTAAHVDGSFVDVAEPASPYGRRVWWPAVCWRIDGRGACHELTPRWVAAEPSSRFPRPMSDSRSPEGQTLDASSTCVDTRSLSGTWYVADAIEWPDSCDVTFGGGTILLFAPGASLSLNGRVWFPERGRVFFRAASEVGWGGIAIQGGDEDDPVVVRNASFEGARDSDRYEAALTIVGGHAQVASCVFADNRSDDAINARDAHVRIADNLFDSNGDAIDLDRSSGVIEGNFIHATIGDGVDLSESSDVVVRGNVIVGSGDKAVSVGERSSVAIENNVLRDATVGIAVKDGSDARLAGNAIVANQVGLWLYSTTEPTERGGGTVRGGSAFGANASPARIGAGDVALGDVDLEEAAGDSSAIIDRVVSACGVCSKVGRDFGLSPGTTDAD
jgi:hypothetical protein